MIEVDYFGQYTVIHKVIAAVHYGSKDRLVILDIPWNKPTDIIYDPNAVVAIREQDAKYDHHGFSPWRNVWGDLYPVRDWALAVNVGDSVKLKGRRFTKIDELTLPKQVRIEFRDYASL